MSAEQSVNDTIFATLLNLPGIIIVQVDIDEQENCLVKAESTKEGTPCRVCGRTIHTPYGHGALVQFDGERYVIEISGQIGLYLSYVIDPINPKMKAMTWTFYDSSARYATLRLFTIIRPIPQRIMVAVSFTNVSTVRPISPRPKIPSWKV